MQKIESAMKNAIVHIPKACTVSVYIYTLWTVQAQYKCWTEKEVCSGMYKKNTVIYWVTNISTKMLNNI